MKIKNMYNEVVEVNDAKAKVHQFNNEKNFIIYNAPIVENGKETGFYTDYKILGLVTDIETKIKSFGNKVALVYATEINFNQDKNDPKKYKWDAMLGFVKTNEEKFFKKSGDFRIRISKDVLDGLKKVIKEA